MADSTTSLKRELRRAGLSDDAVTAAWPAWWSDEAETSPSALAELRFTLARRLGLSAQSLLGERVEFVWRDRARFKHLAELGEGPFQALTSFGAAVGQSLLRATPNAPGSFVATAALRGLLVRQAGVVDLQGLLTLCWTIGVPVIHLRVFPLQNKAMHAMVVRGGSRFAVLLGRDASYPAPVAFTLAHELAHVLLGHLGSETVLVDVADPAEGSHGDSEEEEADRFALELLTGESRTGHTYQLRTVQFSRTRRCSSPDRPCEGYRTGNPGAVRRLQDCSLAGGHGFSSRDLRRGETCVA